MHSPKFDIMCDKHSKYQTFSGLSQIPNVLYFFIQYVTQIRLTFARVDDVRPGNCSLFRRFDIPGYG